MLAAILSGLSLSDNLMEQVKEILFRSCSLFQVQDDFLDCFGNRIVTGKNGWNPILVNASDKTTLKAAATRM